MYSDQEWSPAPIREEHFRVIRLPRGDEFSHMEFKIDSSKGFGGSKRGWAKKETEEELKEQLLKKEAALATAKEE